MRISVNHKLNDFVYTKFYYLYFYGKKIQQIMLSAHRIRRKCYIISEMGWVDAHSLQLIIWTIFEISQPTWIYHLKSVFSDHRVLGKIYSLSICDIDGNDWWIASIKICLLSLSKGVCHRFYVCTIIRDLFLSRI